MQFYIIQPGDLLSEYVRYFWVLEGNTTGNEFHDGRYTHRTMACGCPELFFHYKGDFAEMLEGDIMASSFKTGIQGQSQNFRRFSTTEDFGLFGAFLYPFAVPLLLGIPAEEVNNQMVGLQTLLGEPGDMLTEMMMLANSNTERASILSGFLVKRLIKSSSPRRTNNHRIIPAIRQVIATNGQLSIQSMSDQYFLSNRQFERAFKQYAGFSPKLFSRLLRFENVLNEYGNKNKSLTDIAYSCGYYDQSHFIHEFKEFSGHHPRNYFSGKAEGTEWKE